MARTGRSAARFIRIAPRPNPIRQYSGGGADTAGATDTNTRQVVFPRADADTAAATEAVARTVVDARAVVDLSAATDGVSRLFINGRVVADAITISDAVARQVVNTRQNADSAFGSEGVARRFTGSRQSSDVRILSEAATRQVAGTRNAPDTALGVEAVTRQFTGTRQGVDYRSAILGSGPLAYYRLGESSGNLSDIVGGRTLGISGSVTRNATALITTDSDGSLQFATVAGQNNLLTSNYDATIHGLATNFSVEFWAVADGTFATGTNGAIRNETGSGATGKGFTVFAGGTAGSFTASLGLQWFTGVGAIFPGTGFADWSTPHYFAFTYDGTNIRQYLDGVLKSGPTPATHVPNNGGSGQVKIGSYSGGQTWPGRMDELAWYGKVLSANEVIDHYRAGVKSGVLTTNYGEEVFESESVSRQFVGSRRASAYSRAIVTDAPQSYWRLDELSGTSVLDSIGAITGTVVNGTPSVTRNSPSLVVDTDPATTFINQNGGVTFGDNYGFAGTAPFSFEAWIMPSSVAAPVRRLASKRGTDGSGVQGWEITYNGQVNFSRYLNGASGGASSVFPGGVNPGTLYHVVCTYDGSSCRVYINGALSQTGGSVVSVVAHANPFTVAQFSGNGNVFEGVMDEVAIYDYALSATQVNRHYQLGASGGDVSILSETPTRSTAQVRAALDSAPGTEAVARQFTGTRLRSDSGPAVDALTRWILFPRAITDTATAVDTDTRTVTNSRTSSDSALALDALSRAIITARILTETASTTDSVLRIFSGVRLIADSAGATDLVDRSQGVFRRAIPESALATDALLRSTVIARLIIDSALSVDDVMRFFDGARTVPDIAGAVDLVTRRNLVYRSTIDNVSAIDAVARNAVQFRLLADTALADPSLTQRLFVGARVGTVAAHATDEVIYATKLAYRNVILAFLSTIEITATQDTLKATELPRVVNVEEQRIKVIDNNDDSFTLAVITENHRHVIASDLLIETVFV